MLLLAAFLHFINQSKYYGLLFLTLDHRSRSFLCETVKETGVSSSANS